MPELSIIVTSYNIAPYIGDCLDTITAQTLEDIEIIVVDDGSTDGSAGIIKSYAARDPRIRPIIFEKNTPGGVATAANAGINAATGDYIGFMDGDDLCEPTMFATLLSAARRHDADLAMCRYLEQQEPDGKRHEPAEVRRWLEYPVETRVTLDTTNRQKILRFIAVPWRKIYRRTLLDENNIRFPEGDFFYEDNPFHWFCVTSANAIVLVPEILCYHRVGRTGQTMATADEKLFRIFQHYFIIRQWLKTKGQYETYSLDLLGWAVSQLEWISLRTPPELRERLFEVAAPIVTDYSHSEIDIMIRDFAKGNTGSAITKALKEKNIQGFVDIIKASSESATPRTTLNRASLIQEGLHHLRQHGIISTTALTARHVSRASRSRFRSTLTSLGFNPTRHKKATNEDLLFAITILEKRIDELAKKVSEILKE